MKYLRALKTAFPHTIPIMTGFLFLGFTYGFLMHSSGFSFVFPLIMSITIFGGSLEFVAVSMLLSAFAPVQTLIMTFLIQARHLFYGISMLEKYRGTGRKKLYLIYGLCDETFSINFTMDVPEDVDRGWTYFFVTLLDQMYWVSGALLGGLFGGIVHINTRGLDFVMTAMFVTIFAEQWMKEKRHIPEMIGFAAGVGCLVVFGSSGFMVPTMVCILVLLWAFRKRIEPEEEDR